MCRRIKFGFPDLAGGFAFLLGEEGYSSDGRTAMETGREKTERSQKKKDLTAFFSAGADRTPSCASGSECVY